MSDYSIRIIGEAESPFRGPKAADPELLVEGPDSKPTKSLMFEITESHVKQCLQAGDVAGAWEVIKKYEDKDKGSYKYPLNCFQRDSQVGAPHIGAHYFNGALREAAGFIFDPFYKNAKGKTTNPSSKHFRKCFNIRPKHIFMHRPDLKGEMIMEIDEVQGQSPSEKVRGFARYETINPPFQFEVTIDIFPEGPFKKLLMKKENMETIIHGAVRLGLGGCRGAGYGMWKIVKMELVKMPKLVGLAA